ncbi:MAG: hypothetical protein IPO25_21280 [Saprospiraceae bacterium]|nr:hypothetical protein [Saprospiraceae bacterium]
MLHRQTLTVDAEQLGDIFPIFRAIWIAYARVADALWFVSWLCRWWLWLTSRAFGMNCDCVLEVMVMLA